MIERLVIGSAAFGLPYGATNQGGRVEASIVAEILEKAAALGIDMIDTAPAYGTAEALLGRLPQARRFAVATKSAPSVENGGRDPAVRLMEGLSRSLRALGRRKVDVLLLRQGRRLLGPHGDEILLALRRVKADGLADRVGVSIYDGDEIDAVLSCFRPDIVQLPLNVVDQRLIASGHLKRLVDLGVEVHARSAFLQGLLLAPAERRPHWAADCSHLRLFDEKCVALDLIPLRLCLGFLLARPEVAKVVVGVTSMEEFDAIAEAANAPDMELDWPSFALTDATLLDPRRWPTA